jgi:hypothetical protein
MRANAEFAIVSELTTPASGRLGELLKHFGLSTSVPRLSAAVNSALEICVKDEWAKESRKQCEVLELSKEPSLSLDGVWKNQQRRAKRSSHCSVSAFNGETSCLVALESVSVSTVAINAAPKSSCLFILGSNVEDQQEAQDMERIQSLATMRKMMQKMRTKFLQQMQRFVWRRWRRNDLHLDCFLIFSFVVVIQP